MLAPTSRFSKIVATGIRVFWKTHAPLRLPGTLSTAAHCDQSKIVVAIIRAPSSRLSSSGARLAHDAVGSGVPTTTRPATQPSPTTQSPPLHRESDIVPPPHSPGTADPVSNPHKRYKNPSQA